MNPKEKKLYLILSAIVIALIVTLLLVYFFVRPQNSIDDSILPAEVDRHTILTESNGLFSSEVTVVDTSIVQDELKNVGVLITEEYYFTEVTNYSSTKKLFNIDIGITESSYIASYDGHITAGIDFSTITLSADNNKRLITVHMPKSTVQDIVIDPNSFKLYSEKDGFANHLSISDFNQSLIELNKTAEEKAIAKGILDRADENAEYLISSLISSLIEADDYEIEYIHS